MLIRRRRIVLLGDSISVGSFPFMQRALGAINGNNSAHLVAKVGARTEWMAAPAQIARVLAFDPTTVVIMGGTNDLVNGAKGYDDALLMLLTAATELRDQAEVVISTVAPTRSAARDWTERFNAHLLGPGIPGASIIDAGGSLPVSMIGPDNVHPTMAGYEELGAALARDATHETGLLGGVAMLAVAALVLALPGV